jgi:hypothetical protein
MFCRVDLEALLSHATEMKLYNQLTPSCLADSDWLDLG